MQSRDTPRIVEDGHLLDDLAVNLMAVDLVGSVRVRRHPHLRH